MSNEIVHSAEIFFIDGTDKIIEFVAKSDNDNGCNFYTDLSMKRNIFIPYCSVKYMIVIA